MTEITIEIYIIIFKCMQQYHPALAATNYLLWMHFFVGWQFSGFFFLNTNENDIVFFEPILCKLGAPANALYIFFTGCVLPLDLIQHQIIFKHPCSSRTHIYRREYTRCSPFSAQVHALNMVLWPNIHAKTRVDGWCIRSSIAAVWLLANFRRLFCQTFHGKLVRDSARLINGNSDLEEILKKNSEFASLGYIQPKGGVYTVMHQRVEGYLVNK